MADWLHQNTVGGSVLLADRNPEPESPGSHRVVDDAGDFDDDLEDDDFFDDEDEDEDDDFFDDDDEEDDDLFDDDDDDVDLDDEDEDE